MPEARLFERDDRLVCAAFSPDGRWLALGGYRIHDDPGSGTYRAIVLTDGHAEDQERSPLLCGVFREPAASALHVALDATGRWLATGGADHRVALWDVERGERVRELAGHTAPVWTVAISPDGAQVVSGGHDQTLRLWDARSGRERVCLKLRGPVLAIRVSPDGSHADAAVRWDADVRIELPGGRMAREGRR